MCVVPSYCSLVGEVLLVCFLGMMVRRIFICCFASVLAACSRRISVSFLSFFIRFFSFFWYRVCLSMLLCVGCFILIL